MGLALVAGLSLTIPTASAAAASPTLIWSGAKRLNILCDVAGAPGIDHVAMSTALCRRVTSAAASRAPVPVGTIAIGDPAVLASDAVTVIVHASVTFHKGDRLLTFGMRPFRSSANQTAVLFGAVPRTAVIGPANASPALDAALAASLSETLPWLARRAAPQTIHQVQSEREFHDHAE